MTELIIATTTVTDNSIINDSCNSYNTCNICADNINNDDIIVLKCNITHTFCYDCILSWYKSCEKNIYSYYEYIHRMCPICKCDGGLLPLKPGIDPIKYIHDIPKCKMEGCKDEIATKKDLNNHSSDGLCLRHYCLEHKLCQYKMKHSHSSCLLPIQDNKIYCTEHFNYTTKYFCNAKLKSGFICPKKANYNGKCHIHKNVTDNDDIVLCNTPFKTKFGTCQKIGLHKYGGKCGLHFVKNSSLTNITQTNITNITNITNNLCNKPLKNKSGLCTQKASDKYNGKCYWHKDVV